MQIPQQIEAISIARAANAAHYEYLDTVRKRTEEIRLDNDLWRRAVEEFGTAFKKEDEAFKRYRASDHTAALQQADEERDRLYASLRDTLLCRICNPTLITIRICNPL